MSEDINFSVGTVSELLNEKVDIGHQVIEFQTPTAENNYTWYRKYADGWVEQGGVDSNKVKTSRNIYFPVPMANNNYSIQATYLDNDGSLENGAIITYNRNSTLFKLISWSADGVCWEVKGMAA